MKRICLIAGLLAGLVCAARAQFGPATNAPAFVAGDIEIFSRSSEYDMRTNVVLFAGNVRVVEARMQMTCERLMAKLPERGGHIESVIAEQNVVLDLTDDKGQKVHGTSDKLIYTYRVSATETNELIELTGSPVLDTTQGTVAGEVITFDRITGIVRATNQRMVVRPQKSGSTNQVNLTNALAPTVAPPVNPTPPKEPPVSVPANAPPPPVKESPAPAATNAPPPPPSDTRDKPSRNWPP